MTIILSEKYLSKTLLDDTQSLKTNEINNFELRIQSPDGKSKGYKRSQNLRNGINLLIRNYWLEETLIEENIPESEGLSLEFAFNLFISSEKENNASSPLQESFLLLTPNRTYANTQEWQDKGRLLKIDVHLPVTDFSSEELALIPSELQKIVNQKPDFWEQSLGAIAPNIKLVLQQILNCPYTGTIGQVYLEGKVLELIALQTAQWTESQNFKFNKKIKFSDIDCIHQAREIIIQRLDDPPSLLELAREIGLNDCTLKRGFRQVFGTTVFGYLRQQRLIKAQQLLQETEMTIAQVSSHVGYSHGGHFASAFKREFGVSPKMFKNSF
jgi:AraC family transcriptional regulator, transcriptional activator of the genes for pyochelin and ferripyochelin receptors